MEHEKNNNGLITILISIIVILSVLCILFAFGIIELKTKNSNNNRNNNIVEKNKIELNDEHINTNDYSNETNKKEENNSTLINNLYNFIGINWEKSQNGDCLNYYISNHNYKEYAKNIISLYHDNKNNTVTLSEIERDKCDENCKSFSTANDGRVAYKNEIEKIIKFYNFPNEIYSFFTIFNGLDNYYFYMTANPIGSCHYIITHNTNVTNTINNDVIRITDNQTVIDHAFGDDNKINSKKNQTVTYEFKKKSDGEYYLDNVVVQ